MACYLIANYRITNPEGYKEYSSAVVPVLQRAGAEILVADYAAEPVEGSPANVMIVLKFASKEAARAWYESPEYQAIIHLRTDNTEGSMVFADGFGAG